MLGAIVSFGDGMTRIVTGAAPLSLTPLLTVKVKRSRPVKFSAGVYVRFGSVPVSWPFSAVPGSRNSEVCH